MQAFFIHVCVSCCDKQLGVTMMCISQGAAGSASEPAASLCVANCSAAVSVQ